MKNYEERNILYPYVYAIDIDSDVSPIGNNRSETDVSTPDNRKLLVCGRCRSE